MCNIARGLLRLRTLGLATAILMAPVAVPGPAAWAQGPLESPGQSLAPPMDPRSRPFDAILRPDQGAMRAEHTAADPEQPWTLQLFPEGLIYRSYLAGMKEPRLAGMWVHDVNQGWLFDTALGARAAIARLGTQNSRRPEGLEADCEAAVFPRFSPDGERDLVSADFRIGIPLTYGVGPFQTKLAWYHLSSHLGDEFMLDNPSVKRINYCRDAVVWGNSFYLTDDLRLYAEAEWAYHTDGGAEPWAFQFGVDFSPLEPLWGLRGAPFVAVNTHLREEVRFGGNVVVQTGWQWRGQTGHLFRFGMQYFTGKSDQLEFFRRNEDRLGLGIWYDF